MNMVYENILVAVDGSEEAEWAFKKAISVAKRNDARLIFCHVIDLQGLASYEVYNYLAVENAENYSYKLLNEYQEKAKEAGVTKVETILKSGNPKTLIAKVIAPEKNADLIICGATGQSAIERLFIGSVSEHILRYAKCDVLVVRTPKEVEEEVKPVKIGAQE